MGAVMTDLDIRVGDVVRLKDFKVEDCDNYTVKAYSVEEKRTVYFFPHSFIDEVISRTETDAEKITRLEARIAELEAVR